jgi:hypothetical protein
MDAKWLFFVDSDMDFPPDTLSRLKAMDCDVACLDMWTRTIPSFRMILKMGDVDEKGGRRCVPVVPVEVGRDGDKPVYGVQEADVVGMACTLIKVDLLKKMQPPWFFMVEHGEDASFCFVAKEKYGAVIKCDFGSVSGHWGVVRMAGQEWSRDAKNQIMAIDDPEMARAMGSKNVRG